MAKHRISVLVTAYSNTPSLHGCLERVRSQADTLDAEVLLVANRSEREFSSERPIPSEFCTRVLFVEEAGKSNALNAGVESCESEVIAFTDDDAWPRPGWLEALTSPLLGDRANSRLVGCGGRVLPVEPAGGVPDWYRDLVARSPVSVLGPRYDLGPEPFLHSATAARVRPPIGSNCAYRREVFDEYRYTPPGTNRATGLWGGEDTEFGHRLLLDGYALQYVPDSVVDHPIDADRLTLAFCRQRFFSHGITLIRLQKRLGIPSRSLARARWEWRLLAALHLLRPFSGSWSKERIALQQEKLRGMVSELRSPDF